MSYIDIVIIALVGLCALIGLWRGFFKTLISFFGLLVSFIIAFFLTKPVVGALLDIDAVKGFVVGSSSGGWSLYGWIYGKFAGISTDGVLGTLLAPLLKMAESQNVEPAVGVSLLLANGLFSIMVCVALFIVIRFILLLFTMFANAMTKGKFLGALNRLLGFVFGAVKGVWHVACLLLIMSFMLGLSFMAPVREQLDNSVLGAPIYDQVTKLADKFITGDNETLVKLLDIFDRNYDSQSNPSKEEYGVYKYSDGESGNVYELEIKADNAAELRVTLANEDPYTQHGTYTIEGDKLTVVYGQGEEARTEKYTINVQEGWIRDDGKDGVYYVKDGYAAPQALSVSLRYDFPYVGEMYLTVSV